MYSKEELPKGITQRSKKSFEVYLGEIDGKHVRKTVKTLAEAIALRKRHVGAEDTKGEDTGRKLGQWTIEDAFDFGLERLAADGGWLGAPCEDDVRRHKAQFVEYFGPDTKLSSIRMARDGDHKEFKSLDGFIAWCRSGVPNAGKWDNLKPNSTGTILKKLSHLKTAMRFAHERGGVTAMPAFPRFGKKPKGRVRFYSDDEERRMLNICMDYATDKRKVADERRRSGKSEDEPSDWLEFADMLAVLIDTGMRWGESNAVLREHINKRSRELTVVGISGNGSKNGEIRVVDLTDRAFEILCRRTEHEEKAFTLTYDRCSYMHDTLKKNLGLNHDKQFSIHTARHTFCSRLVQDGVDLLVVAELAGHKRITTTQIYAHLAPKNRRAAIATLNRRRVA